MRCEFFRIKRHKLSCCFGRSSVKESNDKREKKKHLFILSSRSKDGLIEYVKKIKKIYLLAAGYKSGKLFVTLLQPEEVIIHTDSQSYLKM